MVVKEQKGKRRRSMENSEGTIVLEMNSKGELRRGIMRASEHMQNPHVNLRSMSRGTQASQSSVSLIPQSCAPFLLGLWETASLFLQFKKHRTVTFRCLTGVTWGHCNSLHQHKLLNYPIWTNPQEEDDAGPVLSGLPRGFALMRWKLLRGEESKHPLLRGTGICGT